MKTVSSRLLGFYVLAATLAAALPAFASELVDDPLRGFCYGLNSCADNGVITPVEAPLRQFGFAAQPGPQTGDLIINFLLPDNLVSLPSALSFAVTGTQGGASNNAPLAATSSLFSTTAWKKGSLLNYLGLTPIANGPVDGIKLWLPSTQNIDPGATGYYVYQFDLGINKLRNDSKELKGPLFDYNGLALPEGALIAGLVELPTGAGTIATAPNAALLLVPEPASLWLFAAALLGLGLSRRVKRA